MPYDETVPLLVDHDDACEIGRVSKLFRVEWEDGPWIAAHATVTNPPDWLNRDTSASFGHWNVWRGNRTVGGVTAEVVVEGFLREVSVLSPSVKPAEPCAGVLSYRPSETAPPAMRSPEIAFVDPDLRAAQREAAERGCIVRYGIGQVLAVR
jgi:hypothetical protein